MSSEQRSGLGADPNAVSPTKSLDPAVAPPKSSQSTTSQQFNEALRRPVKGLMTQEK